MMQFADQFNMRLISKSILQKLLIYFNGTTFSTSLKFPSLSSSCYSCLEFKFQNLLHYHLNRLCVTVINDLKFPYHWVLFDYTLTYTSRSLASSSYAVIEWRTILKVTCLFYSSDSLVDTSNSASVIVIVSFKSMYASLQSLDFTIWVLSLI